MMGSAPKDTTGSRRATALLLGLLRRSWPTVVALGALRSVWFVAFPGAIVSVGTAIPPWAPLAAGSALDLIGLWIAQRLRRILRTTSMIEVARNALRKRGGVPETGTDAAFWSVWLTEYAMSQDFPGILAAGVGTVAILVVAAVRMGIGLILPVTTVLIATAVIGFASQRLLRPWFAKVVDARVRAASWVAAAERDAGEIGGARVIAPFLDSVAASTIAWCAAEDNAERRQRVHRMGVILLLGAGLIVTLTTRGIDWIAVAFHDTGARVSVREVSDLVLLAACVSVALTAARHIGSLLTGHAELSRLQPPAPAQEPEPAVPWVTPPRDIVIRGLVVRHGDAIALRIDELTVSLEKPLAVSGPNGSGKTTFASVITGVLPPTEGLVLVGGVPSDRIERDAIALVPQDPVLIESLSVAESVRLVAPEASDDAVKAMLARLGLDKPLDRKTGELSKGERRRIAIARALIKDPKLLVLDEPDTWLDVEGRRVLGEILASESGKRAIVIVSHRPDLFEVAGTVVRISAEHEVMGGG